MWCAKQKILNDFDRGFLIPRNNWLVWFMINIAIDLHMIFIKTIHIIKIICPVNKLSTQRLATKKMYFGCFFAPCLAPRKGRPKLTWAHLSWAQVSLGRACLARLAWQGLLGNWFGIGSASCIVVLWLQNYTICWWQEARGCQMV